jgi:hypothetical protein
MSSQLKNMSSLIYLNVGLKRNDNGKTLSHTFVKQVLRHLGLDVTDLQLFESDSEWTAVVSVCLPQKASCIEQFVDRVDAAAAFLRQDCIAVVYNAKLGAGSLIGPEAENWGPFNPTYFIMPDGRRLSEHLERAN